MKRLLFSFLLLISISSSSPAAVPVLWVVRTSNTSNDLHGVGYGNQAYIAVGSEATVIRSQNGIDWSSRSVGTTTATLFCVQDGTLFLGGETSTLLLGTLDGFRWYSLLSTIGVEHIFDIVQGDPGFVAVGLGPHIESSYVVTSRNAYDWATQIAPTTNTLWSVAYANNLFVAVGNRGTIVTSPNGTNWTVRPSGTERSLRAIVFHQSRFLAAGDVGTVLISFDGITWTASAPTSFDVRGLASGNGVVVAVGRSRDGDGGGRLHASADGLSWPGTSRQLPQPLNSITHGADSFVAVGNQGFVIQSEGLTNEWTRAASGDWHEPFWSLGELPSTNHALIALRNPGFKALAIQSSTTADHAETLTIKNLLVDAPPSSANLLLLNYAGLNVPLNVLHDFTIGTNGALLSYFSDLRASNLVVLGDATFAEASSARVGRILRIGEDPVGSAIGGALGSLTISNAALSARYFDVPDGEVIHYAGTNVITERLSLSSGLGGRYSKYQLSNGVVMSAWVDIGFLGHAWFFQTGGIHTNGGMNIFIRHERPGETSGGSYTLSRGILHSANRLELRGGGFLQLGGTNYADLLAMASGGAYTLYGGVLNCSNVSVGPYAGLIPPDAVSTFWQDGGVHTILNNGHIGITRHGIYRLQSGTFNAWSIVIDALGELNIQGGTLINGGGVTMAGGTLRAAGARQLGHLQLVARGNSRNESVIDLGNGSTVVRFFDSSFVRWDTNALLTITNWSGATNGGGTDQLIFGNGSSALAADQLAKIQFFNPAGVPAGRYLARILGSGEVVPGESAYLAFRRSTNGVVFTWSGGFELLTATNISGPFMRIMDATSPYTNSFAGPRHFFQLRSRPK